MTTKKTTPPPLELPRPQSKVEAGLAAETEQNITVNAGDDEPSATVTGGTPSAERLREQAIAAMVAAGLSQEFAEASFVLAEDGASATDVAVAVGELSDAPLCSHGCHGQSWADVRADLDAVSCEHGSFPRRPQE